MVRRDTTWDHADTWQIVTECNKLLLHLQVYNVVYNFFLLRGSRGTSVTDKTRIVLSKAEIGIPVQMSEGFKSSSVVDLQRAE